MAENKRYYWIKLKTDFFDQDKIDFLMGQENGAEYVVIYQMLMLKTAQQNGYLATQMAEIMIPYDVKKIVRDTKYFDYDTVVIALELFKKLGLVYEEDNHIFKLANAEELVGSEAGNANAQRQKRFREQKKQALLSVTNSNGNSNATNVTNSNVDIDKELDIEIKKDIDIENKKESKGTKAKRFCKPTLEEVKNYIQETNLNVNAQYWYDYYESNGWMVGKNHMKDWKACIRRWNKTEMNNVKSTTKITKFDV